MGMKVRLIFQNIAKILYSLFEINKKGILHWNEGKNGIFVVVTQCKD